MPQPVYEQNCNSPESCDFIWSRRRLISTDPTGSAAPGDTTLFVVQDWRWSYYYKSINDARADVKAGKWSGGLNLTVLEAAEMEALGWYGWLKGHASFGRNLTLRDANESTSGSPMGTCTGLTKMPCKDESYGTHLVSCDTLCLVLSVNEPRCSLHTILIALFVVLLYFLSSVRLN